MVDNQTLKMLADKLAVVRYRPSDLTGPRFAALRQEIVAILTRQKEPQSKCGVNRVQDLIFAALEVEGACLREREEMTYRRLVVA